MEHTKRVSVLILIMTIAVFGVAVSTISILYKTALDENRLRLTETVQSRARMMEAVARYNAQFSTDYPGGAGAATISQVLDAHKHFSGFGASGEFTLARLQGDNIIFILSHRHDKLGVPAQVPFQGTNAAPMRRALSGRSGTMIGLDYRGKTVLAAYEPVQELNLGVVAKIEIQEIQAPFITASLYALALAAVFVILGSVLFFRVGEPLILALRKNERRLRSVIALCPVPMTIVDPDGYIEHFNTKFTDTFGWTADDIHSPEEWWHAVYPDPEYRQQVQNAWEVAVAQANESGTEIAPQQWQVTCKNGECRDVEFRMMPLGDINIIVATDLTEQIRMEQVLKSHRDHLEKLIEERTAEVTDINQRLTLATDATGIGAWDLDLVKNELIWDDGVFRLYGVKRDTFGGAYEAWQKGVHPDDLARVNGEVEKAVSGEQEFDTRFRIVIPDGEVRHIKTNAAIVRDSDGLPLHMVGINFDISKEMRAQEALETALETERNYRDLQRKLISLVSHEFRTPLTVIDGTAQRLVRSKDSLARDTILERCQKIRDAVGRMTDLIENILYAARIDDKGVQMVPTAVDLKALVHETCSITADIAPGHEFRIDVEKLPQPITADGKLLEIILTNLLSNAVKFAPDDPLIEVRGWSSGEDVFVTVQDYGIGIAKDDLPNIFQRFFRAKTAEGIKGTGIGLNVSKQLVDMHEGEISVDSIEGQQTTFTVRLPIGSENL